MIVSTKGRYALRVLVDLAENQKQGLIPMKQVAERQGVSLKYLERILPILTKNNYIEGVSGKGGGYRLRRKPREYKLGEILRLIEGNLAPVDCLSKKSNLCERKNDCKTLKVWTNLNIIINDYLDNITLADLVNC